MTSSILVRIVCAWCNEVIDYAVWPADSTPGDSHGICDACDAKIAQEITG